MQITLTELIGFLGIVLSIGTAVWAFADRLGKVEDRIGRLEQKTDEVLICLKHKKKKHAYRKH